MYFTQILLSFLTAISTASAFPPGTHVHHGPSISNRSAGADQSIHLYSDASCGGSAKSFKLSLNSTECHTYPKGGRFGAAKADFGTTHELLFYTSAKCTTDGVQAAKGGSGAKNGTAAGKSAGSCLEPKKTDGEQHSEWLAWKVVPKGGK